MMFGGSLEWWNTPLSNGHYQGHSITDGSWKNDEFVVPIDCMRDQVSEQWRCSIARSIWVRVISDEFYEVAMHLKFPEGPFRGPFYRIVGSPPMLAYEKWLRETGVMKDEDALHEYYIASVENELHILSLQEPSFQKIEQRPS